MVGNTEYCSGPLCTLIRTIWNSGEILILWSYSFMHIFSPNSRLRGDDQVLISIFHLPCTLRMCQTIFLTLLPSFQPSSPHSTSSPPFSPLRSPAVYSNTWLLPIQLACWIFHYVVILVRFHSWAWLGEKEKLPWEHLRARKLPILIRSAGLLVQVFINTIHCVPGEDSKASSPAAVWLALQQLWAGRWKIYEEEKIFSSF